MPDRPPLAVSSRFPLGSQSATYIPSLCPSGRRCRILALRLLLPLPPLFSALSFGFSASVDCFSPLLRLASITNALALFANTTDYRMLAGGHRSSSRSPVFCSCLSSSTAELFLCCVLYEISHPRFFSARNCTKRASLRATRIAIRININKFSSICLFSLMYRCSFSNNNMH